MKSQVVLLVALLETAGESLRFNPSRDIVTVVERVDHEGEPFMSIALPRLDDFLIEGLRDGFLPSLEGWKTQGHYPLFLRELWSRVFNSDGVLLDDPCIHSISMIRQISRFHKKIFEVCDSDRVEAAIERFVQIDSELPSRRDIKSILDPYASHVAQVIFGRIMGEALSSPFEGAHGPGAVAERLGSVSRWDFSTVSYRAQSLVGPENFRPNWESLLVNPPRDGEIPARLVAVPKTAEKPRLISIEPSYNQFVQQSLQRKLKWLFEREALVCSYVDQSRNRSLAKEGSISGQLATLDLSDASDRVAWPLVQELFGFNPAFIRYLALSRSPFVQLPDGKLVLLTKFASMGSALTFPVEAMVFTTLVITAICRAEGDFSRSRIKTLARDRRRLSIYGDDIIVPVEYPALVIRDLEAVGLKVNKSKSFLSGKFRESCGFDGYDGQEVTPVYLRRRFPKNKIETEEMISSISFRNQMAVRYGESSPIVVACDALMKRAAKMAWGPYGAPGHLLWTSDSSRWKTRWNSKMQRLEVMTFMSIPQRREDVASDIGILFKGLKSVRGSLTEGAMHHRSNALKLATSLTAKDEDHLRLDGRPVASKLYYRWAALS